MSRSVLLPITVLFLSLLEAGALRAQDEPGAKGGVLLATEDFQFEAYFLRDAMFLFVWDADGKAVDPRDATGHVEVDDGSAKVRAELVPMPGPHGRGAGYLSAGLALPGVLEGKAQATFEVHGLPGRGEEGIRFEVPFRLGRWIVWTCEEHPDVRGEPSSKCSICGEELVRKTYIFACPKHRSVTSHDRHDLCWLCQSPLGEAFDEPEARNGHRHGHGEGDDHGEGHEHDHHDHDH